MVLKLYFWLLVFSLINRTSAIIISEDNTARLTNTILTDYAGQLEMLTDSDQWTPICQANFNTLVATVACKSFGFVDAESFEFGSEYEFINLNKTAFECTGLESKLSECVKKETHVDTCSIVTLACTAIPLGARCLRVDPHHETYSKGPLQILFDNEWRYVYDASWDVADAQVACRQLGFGGVLNANDETISTNGRGLPDVVIDNFGCTGMENYLYECLHDDWNLMTSRSSDGRVFLVCVPVVTSNGKTYLRIAQSTTNTSYSGVVEILYADEWKPVLNTGWNITEGIVTCRNLGFIGIIVTDQTPGKFRGEPVFDSVKCSGYEESLLQCEHGEWLAEEREDAAAVNLTCIPLCKSGRGIEYRLGGDSMLSYQGRLELKYRVDEDVWGSVCNTAVSIETAHRICSQLEFIQGAINISNNAIYGQGTGYNVLQDLNCTKDDESLIDCEYSDVIDEGCLHSNDVGVTCVPMSEESKPFMDVQLEGSRNSYEGIVKLKYSDGSGYGNVCSRGFAMDAADVICKELGFTYGAFRLLPNITIRERSLGIIMMSDVRCTGDESKLVYCDYSYPGNCTHEEDVGVSCIPIRNDSYITLTDGKPGMYEGKVSVVSGIDVVQVCPDNWAQDESTVVCYELGNAGVLYWDRDPEQDTIDSSSYPVLSFDCIGYEISLLNCSLRMKNIGDKCTSSKGVRVECIRYLPEFFNTSANTTELLSNIDNFLKDTSLTGNLASGSFGHFVVDSPANRDDDVILELPDAIPLRYEFKANPANKSATAMRKSPMFCCTKRHIFKSSFLLSSDLAKLNTSEPIMFEDSSILVYPIGAVFGLDIFASDGSKVSAKTSFAFPINLTTHFDIAVSTEETLDFICVFFDHKTRLWSTEGLTTVAVSNVSIKCASEHTTSFSIMMRVTENKNLFFEKVLSYISTFCLGISISMSLPTFLILLYVRELRLSTRFIIVRNAILCVCLRDCIFLISHRIAELKIKILCIATGACLYYMSLCAFVWTIIWATDIWLKVTFPYRNHDDNKKIYRPLAYVSPLLLVSASFVVYKDNNVDERCWLSIQSGSIYFYFVPVVISLEIICVAWKTYRSCEGAVHPMHVHTNLENTRNIAKTFVPLAFALGITWIIGVFTTIRGTLIFDAIFSLTNGLQGAFICLSQCVFSKQVRKAWKKQNGRNI